MSTTAAPIQPGTDGAEGPKQPLRFDRRRAQRHPVSGRVTVLRRSHEPLAYRQPVCSFQLQDMSDGGLGARCEMPLALDEPVAVFLPPHGAERGIDLLGHIVRCDAGEGGYRIAVQFDTRPAA